MSFDPKTVELIAVGASVAANCLPCLQAHRQNALQAGLTEQEIKEAMEVGKVVRAGAASAMEQLIEDFASTPTPISTPAPIG